MTLRAASYLALVACGRLNFDENPTACPGFAPSDGLPGTYFVGVQLETWANGRFACFDLGGDLAYPTTGSEALALATLATNAGASNPWFGVHDLEVEAAFITVDGDAAFLDFSTGEPNGNRNENCMRMNQSGKYIDDDCFEPQAFICACR